MEWSVSSTEDASMFYMHFWKRFIDYILVLGAFVLDVQAFELTTLNEQNFIQISNKFTTKSYFYSRLPLFLGRKTHIHSSLLFQLVSRREESPCFPLQSSLDGWFLSLLCECFFTCSACGFSPSSVQKPLAWGVWRNIWPRE